MTELTVSLDRTGIVELPGDRVSFNANGITIEGTDFRELSHAEALDLAYALESAADRFAAEYLAGDR